VLEDLGVEPELIDGEREAMAEIVFDKTASRSMLGTIPGHDDQHPGGITAQRLGSSHAGSRSLAAPTKRKAPMKSPASIYELKVTLRDTRPPIWRRIRVRSDVTLFKLHTILQFVMGWMDGHMHQFVAKTKVYGRPDPEFPESENEKKVLLGQVLRKPKDGLVYEYDFGDGWEHAVVLEQVLEVEPGGKYPYVVDGRRACPPEDCGGTGGYEHLLEVLEDAGHPEHAEMVEWVGGSFDPEAFDVGEINRGFHGGWYLPPPADAPRSKTALPRQTRLKLAVPRRRR
jgi:hypothetical protein